MKRIVYGLLGTLLVLTGCGRTPQDGADATVPAAPAIAPPDAPPANAPVSGGDAAPIIEEPSPTPEGMVWIPGGTFQMGAEPPQFPDEAPVHAVTLDGFWMDATEVTNTQFQKFVKATGYTTIAERKPKREDFAGQVADINEIPEENLVAGSICFNSKLDPKTIRKDHPLWVYQVWEYVPKANWKQPEGEGSNLEGREHHPAVHIAWEDAQAYCNWAGRRLPTEAEWEFAARGGLDRKVYPWGDVRNPQDQWVNNIWQGEFPAESEAADGFRRTAPVKSFPANAFGLYDMSGNVWEWCYDWYQADYYTKSPARNPAGPTSSFDPNEPTVPKRVQRGGSFMCSDNYCTGYRVAARMKGDPQSGTFHCGFRTVLTPALREKLAAR